MARTRYATDRGLIVRMGGTMFLLGLVFTGFVIALYFVLFDYSNRGGSNSGSGGGGIIVFVVLIAVAVAFGSYYWSDKIALRTSGARLVGPGDSRDAARLHGVVDRLCALADMPKPRVAIAPTAMPNAFATGRSSKVAVLCATQGLLDKLDDNEELEGVLAHEMSHVAHKDVAVMTIASFLVYAVSFLLIRLLSRYRELSADRSGALLTGQPSKLASALVKVTGDMARIPTRDLRAAEPLNAFYFAPALSPRKGQISLSTLFSTHPSLEKRLAQLDKISKQLSS